MASVRSYAKGMQSLNINISSSLARLGANCARDEGWIYVTFYLVNLRCCLGGGDDGNVGLVWTHSLHSIFACAVANLLCFVTFNVASWNPVQLTSFPHVTRCATSSESNNASTWVMMVNIGGEGATQQMFMWGGSAPRSNPLPFIYHFSCKRQPFHIRVPSLPQENAMTIALFSGCRFMPVMDGIIHCLNKKGQMVSFLSLLTKTKLQTVIMTSWLR